MAGEKSGRGLGVVVGGVIGVIHFDDRGGEAKQTSEGGLDVLSEAKLGACCHMSKIDCYETSLKNRYTMELTEELPTQRKVTLAQI